MHKPKANKKKTSGIISKPHLGKQNPSHKFRPWIGIHKRSFNSAFSTINFKSVQINPKKREDPKKEIIIALLPNRPWHRENDANNLNHNNNIQIVKN